MCPLRSVSGGCPTVSYNTWTCYSNYRCAVRMGEAGIETMVHVTRVLFNPIIPEVFDMRKWLVLNSVRLDAKLQYRLLETPNVILSDQFLIDNPRRNIVELYSERHAGLYVV